MTISLRLICLVDRENSISETPEIFTTVMNLANIFHTYCCRISTKKALRQVKASLVFSIELKTVCFVRRLKTKNASHRGLTDRLPFMLLNTDSQEWLPRFFPLLISCTTGIIKLTYLHTLINFGRNRLLSVSFINVISHL